MKKFISLFVAAATLTLGFTACEDVPAPYSIIPTTPDGDGGNTAEAKGSGSLADPYNCVKANEIGEALASGASTDTMVYIKGIVSSIKEAYSTNYGNASFYISDDGNTTNQFYVYRALYLGNVKYTEGKANIQVGDTVCVYAKITNYMGNTVETVQNEGYLYSLNGKTSDGGSSTPTTGEATGDGTASNPFNSVAANNYVSSLAADVASDDVIYVKGKISSVKEQYSTNYGNASFYISDDGSTTNQFYVFRALYLNNVKYTEGTNIKVGDEVVVCGKVVNYKGNTPETLQNEAYLVSLKSSEVTPDPTPDTPSADVEGTTYTAASFGAANGVSLETITLPDGTTLTFDGGGNSNTPKYYDNGASVRMYPKNSFVINSSKKIEKIFLTCYQYNSDIYNASGELTVTSGTVSTSGNIVAISGINATNNTITVSPTATSGVASQLRFTSITIKYAE